MGAAINIIDHATLTVSTVGIGLSSASPAIEAGRTVRRALISSEDADVRWRADGTAPTSSVGHLFKDGDALQFLGENWEELLKAILFIRTGGTDVKLSITYLD